MRNLVRLLLAVSLGCGGGLPASAQSAHLIDPFLGTEAGGNTFPGPSLPFGMIKPGPDMEPGTGNAGWLPDGKIKGFSQTHVSGTGGGAKYGNILVQPTTGEPLPADHGSLRAGERGDVGYYHVSLTRYAVDAELTSARRTALYRFSYPTTNKANILIDAGAFLTSYQNQNEHQSLTTSTVQILSPTEVSGSNSVTGGWNIQTTSYTIFFYAITDTPAVSWGTWQNDVLHPGSKAEQSAPHAKTGAWLTFPAAKGKPVYLKIGISFISVEQAKQNALSEIRGFDFEVARASALKTWDTALSPIVLHDVSDANQKVFYSALYHTMLMPVDRTGENPLWKSDEPYYDDFYAIWDTFRTSTPLLTLIAEQRQINIDRALIDLYRHEGWLPDARSGNFNGRTQGGSNADIMLADGFVKHLAGVDWATAYKAVVQDAEAPPADQIKEGRGDLEDWNKLGYLSIEGVDRPTSKTMEYAADDFGAALMAKGLHHNGDYQKYLKRSGNWANLWDTEAKDGAFSGFVWSRHRDGKWKAPFDSMSTGSWGSDTFYEGNSWTYSTFVPQDVAGLIRKSGGNSVFVDRMNAFFKVPGRFDVSNEPGFLAPYLFIWAGRQDLTAFWMRDLLAKNFHGGRDGIPGNDDSGAMSSWYAFGKLGIYPNAGQAIYVIGSPAFPQADLHLANGKTFTIKAAGVSETNLYVSAATWNGKPLARAWLTHDEILEGGTLLLTMAPKPSSWPSGPPPPSSSDAVSH